MYDYEKQDHVTLSSIRNTHDALTALMVDIEEEIEYQTAHITRGATFNRLRSLEEMMHVLKREHVFIHRRYNRVALKTDGVRFKIRGEDGLYRKRYGRNVVLVEENNENKADHYRWCDFHEAVEEGRIEIIEPIEHPIQF